MAEQILEWTWDKFGEKASAHTYFGGNRFNYTIEWAPRERGARDPLPWRTMTRDCANNREYETNRFARPLEAKRYVDWIVSEAIALRCWQRHFASVLGMSAVSRVFHAKGCPCNGTGRLPRE